MNAIANLSYATDQASRPRTPDAHIVKLFANSLIALAVFLGGFVIREPAPYEVFLAFLVAVWFVCGMRIPREIAPLLFLFTVFNFGGIISSFMIADYMRGIIYVAVSYFLALSSVFFAIVIGEDMGRLRLMYRAYVVGAVLTSILGIIGYFGVGGFEMFTRYSRAMGAFQDPNVYAPFLTLPILYLIYGIMNRSPTLLPIRAGALMILLIGLFLAFSRAAWGLAVITALIFYVLLIINEQQSKVRMKYIILGAAGFLAICLLLLIALQIPAVSDLFEVRAKAVQDYDGGRIGRFARHLIGYQLALEKPWGIGPIEFGYIFTEDTHNIYLKGLMDYGWIGFVALITLFLWTTIAGFKLLFRQRPWLPYYQIAYVIFIGHTLIGHVIDIDHWRHFYFLIGVIWGCMLLEAKWQRALASTIQKPSTVTDVPAVPGNKAPLPKGRQSLLTHIR